MSTPHDPDAALAAALEKIRWRCRTLREKAVKKIAAAERQLASSRQTIARLQLSAGNLELSLTAMRATLARLDAAEADEIETARLKRGTQP